MACLDSQKTQSSIIKNKRVNPKRAIFIIKPPYIVPIFGPINGGIFISVVKRSGLSSLLFVCNSSHLEDYYKLRFSITMALQFNSIIVINYDSIIIFY